MMAAVAGVRVGEQGVSIQEYTRLQKEFDAVKGKLRAVQDNYLAASIREADLVKVVADRQAELNKLLLENDALRTTVARLSKRAGQWNADGDSLLLETSSVRSPSPSNKSNLVTGTLGASPLFQFTSSHFLRSRSGSSTRLSSEPISPGGRDSPMGTGRDTTGHMVSSSNSDDEPVKGCEEPGSATKSPRNLDVTLSPHPSVSESVKEFFRGSGQNVGVSLLSHVHRESSGLQSMHTARTVFGGGIAPSWRSGSCQSAPQDGSCLPDRALTPNGSGENVQETVALLRQRVQRIGPGWIASYACALLSMLPMARDEHASFKCAMLVLKRAILELTGEEDFTNMALEWGQRRYGSPLSHTRLADIPVHKHRELQLALRDASLGYDAMRPNQKEYLDTAYEFEVNCHLLLRLTVVLEGLQL